MLHSKSALANTTILNKSQVWYTPLNPALGRISQIETNLVCIVSSRWDGAIGNLPLHQPPPPQKRGKLSSMLHIHNISIWEAETDGSQGPSQSGHKVRLCLKKPQTETRKQKNLTRNNVQEECSPPFHQLHQLKTHIQTTYAHTCSQEIPRSHQPMFGVSGHISPA